MVRGSDRIIPFAVEIRTLDVEAGHFRANLQAGFCGRRGDQIDDHAIADQGFGAPILGDEGEQTMLDLVPFAGSRREVMNFDRYAEFVGQPLQLAFPRDARVSRSIRPRPP